MTPLLLPAWQRLVTAAPDAPAVIEASSATTYSRAKLTTLVDTRAAAWSRQSSPALAGRWIAFSRPNSAAWFECFLAALKLGAVPVPLDPGEPLANQRALAAGARAHVFVEPDGSLAALANPRRPTPQIGVVKLTSGSTGAPRALAFTDAQMLADGRQVCASMDIRPSDTNLAVIPLGHSYGLGNLVLPLLAQGTPLVCASAPLPHALAADLARWRPTVFPAVPALLHALTAVDLPPGSLESLRVVISAGSPLPATIAQTFAEKFGRRVHSFYGSSETGGITYDRTGDATLTGRSVGTPLDGVVLQPTRGGRFSVESPAVFTHGNRRATRSPASDRRGPLGRHVPADRAEFNAHGELVLRGRTGRMHKIAGRRVDLAGLEQELKRLPGVRDAFVAPHPRRPEDLAAVLATDLSVDDARDLLRRALAAWKLPRRLVLLPTFPLTARGKPDTRTLLARLAEK